MIEPARILKRVIMTEKASDLSANQNRYSFEVAREADRGQIARAIEKVFEVEVRKVNILNVSSKQKRNRMVRGRSGTKAGYKKAIITLKEGDKIELV